jgi:hypothetical protein
MHNFINRSALDVAALPLSLQPFAPASPISMTSIGCCCHASKGQTTCKQGLLVQCKAEMLGLDVGKWSSECVRAHCAICAHFNSEWVCQLCVGAINMLAICHLFVPSAVCMRATCVICVPCVRHVCYMRVCAKSECSNHVIIVSVRLDRRELRCYSTVRH